MAQSPSMNRDPSLPSALTDSRDHILTELGKILGSDEFKTSKRSQRLLRHLVEETLAGRQESLKERVLAIELFGRKPSYDSADDSSVRVGIHEVRRRLQQHYASQQPQIGVREMRIQLAPGTYIPSFEHIALAPTLSEREETAPLAAEEAKPKWIGRSSIIALAATGLVGLALAKLKFGEELVNSFWAPLMSSKIADPVLVCVGLPQAYRCSGSGHETFLQQYQGADRPKSFTWKVPQSGCETLTPVSGQFVGVGDTVAISQLAPFLKRHGKSINLRFTNDVSLTDLKNSSVILLGAFSNSWTLRRSKGSRFIFDTDLGARILRDRQSPSKIYRPQNYLPSGTLSLDYAVASRHRERHGDSENITYVIAGLTQYGTGAAADLVFQPKYSALIEQHLNRLDAGIANLEILLKVPVVEGIPGSPVIIAVHSW